MIILPHRIRLLTLSTELGPWTKWGLFLFVFSLYWLAFPWMIELWGLPYRVLPISYIFLAALLWGMKKGLLLTAAAVPASIVILKAWGYEYMGGFIVPVMAFGVAAIIGRMSDLSRELGEELAARLGIEQEIEEHREHLETLVKQRTQELLDSKTRLEAEIAERVKTEERLEESEAFYRSLVESSFEAICVFQDGKTRYANQKAMEASGYSWEEMQSIPFLQIVHPEDRERALESHMKRLRGENPPQGLQLRIITKNGGVRWIENNGSLISWQGRPATLNMLNDITERRLAGESLQKSEERYKDLFNSISDWICTHDLEGRILTINDSALHALGYERDQIIGMSMSELMKPEYREAFYSDYLRRIKTKGFAEGVVSYRSRQGESFIIEYRNTLLDTKKGEVLVSGVGRDITRQWRQNKQMQKLSDQLRQAQKMEAIGTIAGGVAHEFNNILGAILGFTELAIMNNQRGKSNAAQLEMVLKASDRAKNLVNQILTFSRKTEVNLEPLDLNVQVKHAANILEKTIPRMIQIEIRPSETDCLIMGNANQIEQILLNLGANAADAMPLGGRLVFETKKVTVGLEDDETYPDIEPGEYVRLSVSDTGTGMDRKTLDQMFDPFFTTKEVGKGTGLGLSTTFGIVRSHGGHIHCRSKLKKGTTFDILFPAPKQIKATSEKQAFVMEEIPGGNETILLVDDEEALREIGKEVLSRQGYTTIAARSGEEALEIYREKGADIDLVILDLNMPGMGGYNCLLRLKEIDPNTRVVIATGYSKDVRHSQLFQAGTAAFIAKPFGSSELLKIVRTALDRRRP
ncbi:MAG: PAS domain S-box protein [Deltaproteobacteria bacterium]|nr:PAS domain S-box protein [Deltaproteobacteria bacterium]